MEEALSHQHEMSTTLGVARARVEDLDASLNRASIDFSLAHVLAVSMWLVAAILMQRSATTEGLATPAVICLGLTAALILSARHRLRTALLDEARHKGLVGAEARAYVRDQLARHSERRSRRGR